MSSVGDVFDRTFRALRPRWRPLVAIMAVEAVGRYLLLLSGLLGAACVAGVKFVSLMKPFSSASLPQTLLESLGALIVLALGVLVALALFEAWIMTALFYAAEQPAPTVSQALRAGLEHSGSFGWVLTLVSLLALAGALLLILPGVVASFLCAFAPSAYFLEGRRGFSALRRSWEAMSGRWLEVGGCLAAGWGAALALAALAAASGVPLSADMACVAAGPWIVTLHSTVFRELTGREPLA